MTKSIFEFVRYLTNLSIELEADGVSGAAPEELRLRCHAPEGVLTPSLRQEIAARKTEILLFLQQAKQVKTSHQSPIQKVSRDGELPLSFAQQRLWFLHHLSPNSRSYNLLDFQRLNGSLNIVALEQSLSEIIRRHEIWRTTFPTIDGQPVQVISPPTALTLPVHNLQGLSTQEQSDRIQQIAQSFASQPFDLAVGPLVQFTLLQLSDQEYVLISKMHHIIYDGWSLNIFKNELSQLYIAFTQGLSNPLPELPIQYADFAVWQRQWLTGEVLERQMNYWEQKLADAPVALELPTDKPRLPVQSFRGGVERFQLDSNLTQRLKQLSQESDATLFMTLLAAFLVLISRYSNQLDIVVGTPIANRNNKSVEQLIGFFANTLALRGDLSGNPSFVDFLAQVRQTTLSAYTHQDLPFEMLVEKLQPERDLSRNPLVQVMFSLQSASQSFWDLPGLTTQKMSLPFDEMVRFDLEVNYWEASGGLEGVWSYSTDLFDAATIARIAQNFQTLLQAIVANPKARIAELPLLTPAERHQLLVEWNNTEVDYSSDKCVHQLFEEQVKRTPDAVAVVFENQQLTYQQLNTRANQLAHHLRSLGVRADVLVGLCVERSIDMIVGILGILKAGGAYVPLDPDYPQERLAFMLEDAQVEVLLTQQQLVESLPKHQARVVCLDTDWQNIAQNISSNQENTATPDNLAYVIYTSGSTGKPKGVLVNHSNVTRLFAATDAWYKFNSDDVWTLFHSYAFDFSVWEIWGALLYGGRLVVVPYLVTRSPESFYQLLAQEKVTILNQTPSAFRQLIQAEQSVVTAGDLSLRFVIFGGEALELSSLQPWFEKHGDKSPQLVNMYGITETTVHVTYRPLSKADLQSTASVVGRPIPDLQVYVLDEHLQPVPIGVGGEMYVGGAGVTCGYLNRLELTQQRFISNPFVGAEGSKLYKTGDKARYLPNGELEYLGRIDNQVKIRGFRIELGEIEALLASHPDVWESVVVVREDEPGDKRLVAYLVASDESLTTNQLRQFLKAKLPEYMIPSALVLLKSLPLTANGKVDRRALPKPDLDGTILEKYVAPRTPVEEILVQIWAQILKLEQVGIHDNFFELGGHSLLATQLVSRIRNIFKVELSLRELFAAATVAELGQSIGQLQQQNLELYTPPIVPRVENLELPLSFAQQRLWFLDQLQPNSSFYNIPVALRILGTLDRAALEQSLLEIIHRHEALRTNFIVIDGQPTQVIQTQTNWTVSIVNLQHLPTTEQEIATQQLAQQKATQPFDLATQALVRATLVILSETEQVLLLCMHHIVSDGWSIDVFIEELAVLYNAYSIGQPSPLAPLPVQYADFALWQRQWLQGNVLQSQLSYWQQQLANAPTLLPLPIDRPRPAVQTFSGAYQEFPLSVELTNRLVKLSQEQGATLFMTLLAAFDTLLYRYTGQEDILVGSPIANRDRSEIEGLIGFFVNTLVMRSNLAGDPSFSELLGRVRDMAMQAYTHQDLPFEMLLEALQPERDLSHTPLFQVMFSLQNSSLSQLELTGLTVNHLKVEGITAKFDLTLLMQKTSTGLVGVWEYNTDLFDASTIERMTSHFVTLLEGMIANPEQPISQLPLLTQTEQQQLLVEWNDTSVDYPLDKCIHQLFEEQVERTPNAVAVVFENQQLTYHQLNYRANQLAHYLKSLGVGADVLVGICVERSIEMLVGLLGILKAGGAYLPLDPEYPTGRLHFMLEDAQVRVLLTQQQLVDRLAQQKTQIVCLDTDAEVIAQFSQDNPIHETQVTNLAYVIYTSGSTGQPKGVLIAHQGLLNLVLWHQRAFEITPLDKATQLAGTAFDAAVWELWPYLTAGASIYLVKSQLLSSLENLRDWLISNKITISFLPTPLAQELLSLVWPTEGLALRTILTGGDKLHQYPSELIPFQVVNNYGPTENTVVTTSGLVVAKEQEQISPSIGKAIANTKVYILDRHLQPVPVGVPGELHIGGLGLARGYLNRDELTQERFIKNPFDNSKLYKTGDLARYLPDGNIEYLGRIDNQVKIRGFRIELGEIEAALSQNSHVQASCVIPREDTRDDTCTERLALSEVERSRSKRLVAYIVPHQDSTPTISELRQYLKAKLPDYMVPSAFVILESLPLTPNGKVDRRALPKPDLDSTLLEKYVAPRTPGEEILAQIWAQVLKVEQMGIHDNFFELGGHSLLATQLLSRIRNIFKVELSLRELFAKATVAELAQSIGQLQQQNRELISPPILRRAKDAELPLSFAQTRLWFLDQFEPNTALYNIPIALRLAGTLNQAALEQSLIEIVHRHEALRTNFIAVDGKPSQVIQTQTNWTVSVVDLKYLSTAEQKIAAQQLAQQQATQPFELATQALVRATLIVLSETEHALLVCMHHIVSDGWSIGVFVQELASLYTAYSQGELSLRDATRTPLTPLPIQYADFALWQRNWLQADVLQSQLDYWQKQLADAPTLLALPTDRPRPAVQTFAGTYQKFALSAELTQKLKKLSQEQGVTLFMTLFAAFDTLLYRYTGQEDILVGSPIANRDRSELEGLIGFFVNTLVLRTNVSDNPSFSELLGRVREMAIDAYAHQDLPFEMLVEALQPERDLSHAPLFQVMFVLENESTSQLDLAGLTVSPLVLESATAKFDLTLGMENTPTGLVGAWEYNTDLFDASTIERLTGHFITLLEGIVANPQERISQLPLLTTTEQQQLLVEWNNTQADYPENKCIHQLFEEQVERSPDAVAVVFEGEQLTYQQLNTRANQLAHHLRSLGVKPDVLVGICVDRSIEMVVGLLGILKAGGAYVPLDPDYPTERLRFMLEDAQVPVLLTQQHLIQKLPEHQAHIVYLDTDAYKFDQASEIPNLSEVKASNLAYVLYTSGSTGRPKAVAIEHHSPVALVSWAKEVFTKEELAGVLASTSICFDLSVFELFVTLSVGGKVILAQNALHLSTLSAANQVTLINTVPSAIAQLIRDDNLPQQVCTVNLAGEPLQNQLVQQIYQRSQVKRVFNLYGPSEDTTYSTFSLVEQGTTTSPTIGRPISNTQIYIVDQYLQPVPVGIPGELHIGGAGLARGYLNRPELTQEKFILNPFDAGRLYKTGDLVRYLPDGNIEYLGRIDNQVKIRGFRIELGEIEAVLSQHSDLQASCIIAREDTLGDKRLVAYVVAKQGYELSISQLRSFLSGQLPQYMVPHTFVILESLPLTPNGKIDRRALPEPNSVELLGDSFVAPCNQIEEILTQIWAEVLRVKQVGIHDNFFELGGDSILSIQILAKAKQAGLQLTLKQLFGNQTIAQLAAVADTIKAIEVEQGLVTGELPLTPIQHWFFEQNLSQPHHFNQSFLLSVPSDLKPELLQQALQQLLVHHDALRLRFTQSEFTWQQIHSALNNNVAFSHIDLSALPESEQQAAIEAKAASLQASLNLSENLVQVAFFALGIDKRARLLIAIHHLVVDGVSWRILLEDLQTAYQQLAQGQVIELPAKTTSFKDWSYKLTEYAQSETLKSEVAYWLNESRSSVPSIPIDHIRGANTVASTGTVLVSLNEAETLALLQDVPKAYNTQINDVLLTALALVLSSWTNSKSVLFNLEGHGREDIIDGVDLSRTVGWFTTIFPVLVELKTTKNPAVALKSVKEQLRAIPNKGIGYGLLRYLSQDSEIVTKLQAFPQAQISFNYLGQFDRVLNKSTWMQLANEFAGVEHSLDNNRVHLLDISSIITGEQLQINWIYSKNVHQHRTIENLAQEFVKTLQELIAHCLDPQNGGYTPSDFPLVKLDQRKLDQLLVSPVLKQGLQTNWQNLEDIYPLSPMQQGMLFESLYAPDSGVYFEQVICNLTGNLNVKAFEKAWQQLVAQHSILRTGFVWEQLTQPLQVVYRQVKVTVEVYNWQELSAQEQQQQLKLFLESQRQQGFQLSVAPLMRLHLIQLSTDSYQFVWSHHHLLLDGWSLPLVFKDLLDFYQAISQGESLHYQSAANYRNYIAWLQKQDLTFAKKFWRQKLQGFTVSTPLVVDKLLPNREDGNVGYSEQQIQLTVPITAAVGSFVRQHQLTISNLVQATWAILLCRYSQETDVVFGTTVSGRPPSLMGIESMVGLFINTLPVRVQVSADTQVLDLLKDLQAQQVESEQYSYSSLADIQGFSEVPRGMSLFESIVVFENYPVDAAMRSHNYGFNLDNIHGIEQTNYPLTLVAIAHEQLLVKISYDTSRFDDTTIARMLGHFQTLLEGIVTNPKQPISQLPLLTPSEQQQLIFEWNDTTIDYPVDKCIHQLFEEQVGRTPNAVAVVYEDQQLTYWELNCRANQLAHYLRSLGVGADVLVGLCVERSIEMVVGLLAILKAGGAYVPLDPTYPQERLAYMLKDSQVRVLLSQEKLLARLPEHGARVVCLDTNWENISTESKDNPISDLTTDNLAYVIYTSGSTGKPKGVLVNHSNVVRLFAATDAWYKFNSEDVWTMFHSYAFDFSVWEIWGALLYGGRLVVVPYLVTRSPESFYNLLCQEKVTVLNQTPSAFRQLIQAEQSITTAGDLNLRLVIFGGEALELKSLQPWFERHGDTIPQLVNMYGITETTVHVTYRPLSKADLHSTASVIGHPIPDLQVYVLDEHLQPVPIGVSGEMYVGGAGVTNGYLNRLELTQQRFISHPFSKNPQARLYKTGDKARYLLNGELEYLGRIDNQVKVRGFRIELGEIEALLATHPDVWENVVVVREDEPGDKRLVAYVVPQAEQSLTTAELRRFLSNQLPSYMVPSAFVQLEALPLTANGKVDRRALRAPDSARPELEDVFVAPSTREEKILAAIWAKVLGVEQVGINDNYFALGGDSIRSIQVLSEAKEQGLGISLVQLFQHQTISQLVQELKTQEQNLTQLSSTQPFSPIAIADKQSLPDGIEDAYPLAMLQMGMLYHSEYSKDNALYHEISSFHLETHLDIQLLQVAVQDLVNHHAVLRTSFDLSNFSIPLQLVHQQVELPLQVEDWCHLNHSQQEEALTAWFEAEKRRHFDWTHPPLLRFFVHLRTQETFNLTLSCHHAILDGWSVSSMMTELFSRYLSLLDEQTNYVSPPLSIAYRDFVALEQQAIASSSTQQYWNEKLQDSTFTKIPRWSSVPTNTNVIEVGLQDVTLSPQISESLKQLAQSAEVPLKSVLLAAHLRVLSLLGGQSDVLTGLVANGRPEQNDGERVLGLFLNTLPFRLELTGGKWIDLVRQVFVAEREMLPHRRYPLAEIQRNLGGEPLFETAFNFVHFHVYQQVLELDNLQLLGVKFFEQTNFTFAAQFSVNPRSSEVELRLQYDALKLCPEQINRIGEYYLNALVAMANQPQGRYELHSLVSEREQHQLLIEWNHTQADYSQDKCIHELFAEQVEQTPDAVAVICDDRQLTYQQLNTRANQLAHYLRSLGVGTDVLVGLCVERSLEMLVGLLGILKAGGACVSLDPDYPQDRLSFMLEDAQVAVLITQQHLVERLPENRANVVCLDTELHLISEHSQENPIHSMQATNLAYVIYTSGSTGRPKGVMVSHGAIANHCCIMQEAFALVPSDRVLQFTSINFDPSWEQIFSTLTVGATLLVRGSDVWTPTKLHQIISDFGLTVVNLPTAYWQQLTQEWATTQVRDENSQLRLVIVGGEAMLSEYVALWQQLPMSSVRLVNAYGPTEATITATLFEIPPQFGEDTNLTTVPIGRHLINKTVYILDSHLQPVPVCVPGELHIGGNCLAQGYLNRPELTNEKFIPNPFSADSDSRLYKTGDLARYLPDGNIEYLGRIDNQVKVRGFRVELGEIEAVLSQHDDVQLCCVIAREDTPGDKNLVAYIVSQKEMTPTNNELRQFLKTKLSEYMIPNAFVFLKALPLTTNSKIDRRALPAPSSTSNSDRFVAPRNHLELQLTQLWLKILKIDKVGVQDNFFDLGGHSLVALYLMAQIKQQFGKDISLATFLQNPSIEQLATIVQKDLNYSNESCLVAVQAKGSQPPLFCVPGAGGTPFYLYNLARCLGEDQPFYSFQANSFAILTKVEDIATQYIQALQNVQPQGPYFLAGHSFGGKIAFEMAQQLLHKGHEVALVTILDSTAPFYQEKPIGFDWNDARWLAEFARSIERFLAKKLDISDNILQSLVWEEQLKYLLQRLKMVEILPPDADIMQLNNLVQVLKTNSLMNYVPQQVYPTQIALLRSSETSVEEPIGELPSEILQDSAWGWNKFSAAPVDVQFVPGNHTTMMTQPHVQVLAERLRALIEQANI
ncbi:non-ribosomal peptide synthase/polyketide synthase [Phormidium sp. LEGE 05292]|uniref:non-ribosomal peptide synthase/polyketide synthase n=1 Tax=[Phormidium] sp. LEGE 05292 TaxID=767427 RepID=UPI001880A2E3|nr:non-ribosomal peptide synthase/polyketide synthase [Phormidium sp. LEGE 05292]MBE9228019.1 non-ribosomal peptide synthase/polyketide synthase [Phormidium sp. LEGE 05292]